MLTPKILQYGLQVVIQELSTPYIVPQERWPFIRDMYFYNYEKVKTHHTLPLVVQHVLEQGTYAVKLSWAQKILRDTTGHPQARTLAQAYLDSLRFGPY
jgi:hypothetical protein